MAPPASDERQSLLEFLRFNQNAFVAVAYGLNDKQARSTPSVSALSIAGSSSTPPVFRKAGRNGPHPRQLFLRETSVRWKRSWRSMQTST
jgi:hypothetical protein